MKHNQDMTNTFKKGFNQFSDMTPEEFFDYYHLNEVHEEQHCSATANRVETRDLSQLLKDIP